MLFAARWIRLTCSPQGLEICAQSRFAHSIWNLCTIPFCTFSLHVVGLSGPTVVFAALGLHAHFAKAVSHMQFASCCRPARPSDRSHSSVSHALRLRVIAPACGCSCSCPCVQDTHHIFSDIGGATCGRMPSCWCVPLVLALIFTSVLTVVFHMYCVWHTGASGSCMQKAMVLFV